MWDIVEEELLSYRVVGAIHSIKTTCRVHDDVTVRVFEDAEHVGRVVDLCQKIHKQTLLSKYM